MERYDADGVNSSAARTWINGRLYEGSAPLGSAASGLLFGDGLYEVMRIVGAAPVLLDAHIERMLSSAAALKFDLADGTAQDLDAGIDAVLQGLPPDLATSAVRLRLVLARGMDPSRPGAGETPRPTLVVQLGGQGQAPPPPRSGVVLDAPRIDPLDPLGPHKTLSTMRWTVARMAARARGADIALLRTIGGDMACADAANLFLVEGESVVTPPLSRGILPGVTRAWAIEALRADAVLVVERPVEPDELLRASEVFVTSSEVGVASLGSIDGQTLATAQPVARRLDAEYRRTT